MMIKLHQISDIKQSAINFCHYIRWDGKKEHLKSRGLPLEWSLVAFDTLMELSKPAQPAAQRGKKKIKRSDLFTNHRAVLLIQFPATFRMKRILDSNNKTRSFGKLIFWACTFLFGYKHKFFMYFFFFFIFDERATAAVAYALVCCVSVVTCATTFYFAG